MSPIRVVLPRRIFVLGAAMGVATAGAARAQSSHEDKFRRWVHLAEYVTITVPLKNGLLLGFRYDEIGGRQIGTTRGTSGAVRTLTVIAPHQPDRVILMTSDFAKTKYAIHRTDTHLKRVASARQIDGKASAWSGPECEADFAAQVDFWIAETLD
ncbi:MAG: hypothetical protein JO055_00710 [Alphaproteobacteria bacterium]|nr:hypothetical protein [Alphaproteobacteria bacterium]